MRDLGFKQCSSHSLFLGLSPAQSSSAPRKESPTYRMTMSLPWSKVCSSVTSSQPTSDCSLTCGEEFSTSLDPPGSEKPYLKAAFQHLSASASGPSQTSQEPGCSLAYRESTMLKCEKAGVSRGILQPMRMESGRNASALSLSGGGFWGIFGQPGEITLPLPPEATIITYSYFGCSSFPASVSLLSLCFWGSSPK